MNWLITIPKIILMALQIFYEVLQAFKTAKNYEELERANNAVRDAIKRVRNDGGVNGIQKIN